MQVYKWFYFYFNWQNSNLSTWSLALSAKTNDKNTDEIFFVSLEFDFIRVQLKFVFKTWLENSFFLQNW